MENFYFQVAVKAVEDNGKADAPVIIEGFASTPTVDRHQDIVEPEAFKEALEVFMKNPVMLFQHDPKLPAGVFTSATVTSRGLKVRGEVRVDQYKDMVRKEIVRALSIGYIIKESELMKEDGTAWNPFEDGWDVNLTRVIKKLDLVEISLVTTPANSEALFSMAKSFETERVHALTKAFHMKNKPKPAVNADEEQKKAEAEAATAAAETKAKKPAEGEEKPAEKPAEKPKEAPVTEAKAEPANNETENESEKSKPAEGEASEKGEQPSGTEEAKGEESEADEAEQEAEEDEAEASKAVTVDEKTAAEFPELVEVGLVVKATEGKQAEAFGAGAAKVIKTLIATVEKMAQTEKELRVQLDGKPAKKSLKMLAQHAAPAEADEKGGKPQDKKTTKNQPSKAFQSLFPTAFRK